MPLPSVEALFASVKCFPQWVDRYKTVPRTTVSSGCATVNGDVQCVPERMAQAAAAKVGFPVSLEMYTLARYGTSEVGSGTITEIVAVMQAAVNRARLEGTTVNKVLLYRQKATNPHYGKYGPIHAPTTADPLAAPYGRWAATSRDPSILALVLARDVLNGMIPDSFNLGADDQNGPEHFKNPVGKVVSLGKERSYWVGPLPGVNPWHTMLYRKLRSVSPTSLQGQMLIARGVQAMQVKKAPDWSSLPICTSVRDSGIGPVKSDGTSNTGKIIVGSLLISGGLIAMAVAARKPI